MSKYIFIPYIGEFLLFKYGLTQWLEKNILWFLPFMIIKNSIATACIILLFRFI